MCEFMTWLFIDVARDLCVEHMSFPLGFGLTNGCVLLCIAKARCTGAAAAG